MTSFNLATVFTAIAAAVPDNEAVVWRDRRMTYRELDGRATAVARFLAASDLGIRADRATLAPHESGQDHLGICLRNGPEYVESLLGGSRARVAPFNVNYRFVAEELQYLLADADARALIFHEEFAPAIAEIRQALPNLQVLIQVADGSGHGLLEGAVDYERVISAGSGARVPPVTAELPAPSGEDLYVLYTGGTTGRPKGVLWRQQDIYISSMGGTPFGSTEPYAGLDAIASNAAEKAGVVKMLLIAPLMHGAAQWAVFGIFTNGGTVVIPDDVQRFDARQALEVGERERVMIIPVVGDAFALPIVEQLERAEAEGRPFDLSGLLAIANGSAPLTPGVRARLLKALPHIRISDSAGSSEAGIQMNATSTVTEEAECAMFLPLPDTAVVDDERVRVLRPGEGEGWLARRGLTPLGYLGDPVKTAVTFPVIDGVTWAVPGDRAEHMPDGRIKFLGRDSVTINSGGEKIFVEEVERALLGHAAVRDVLVAGRPSERWGSEVVALVELNDDDVTDEELLEECGNHVARFKVPKAVLRVPQIVRSPSGKADYRWARRLAEGAVDLAGVVSQEPV